MKNPEIFEAFVAVVQAADLTDTPENHRLRKSLNHLNELLRKRGYEHSITWRDALRKSLT